MGGPGGGPLQVSLDQAQFDELSTELFQKARLPLDQACWTAGVSYGQPGAFRIINSTCTRLSAKHECTLHVHCYDAHLHLH